MARLLVRPQSGLGLSDMRKQLFPFVSHTLTDAGWRAELTEVVARLRDAKLVKRDELELTAAGIKEILARLSLKRRPKRISWPAFLAEVVVPAAMSVEPEQVQVKTGDDLVALLLAQHFDLPVDGCLSLPRVLNAIVWRSLGEDSDERLTSGALQRTVLKKELTGTRIKEPTRLARILSAKVSGARAAGAASSRQAILRDWLAGKGEPEAERDVPAPEMRIETFAEAALSAARDPQTVRFGTHKAFIDSVFERFLSTKKAPGMELPTFKQQLVAAHRKGLLTLARADLVEAMDPKRVAASETHYLNTTFHFVEAD